MPKTTFLDGTVEITPDLRPLVDQKADKIALLNSRHAQAMLTFNFNGQDGVASDDQAQNRVATTLKLLEQPELANQKVGWELLPGLFLDLDHEGLRLLGIAMGIHVQACWGHFREVLAQITSPAIDTEAKLEAVDIVNGWPG